MFVETSQVVIINHNQEVLSKRKALSGVAMETSPHPSKYVFTKTLKIYTHIFISLLFQSCKPFSFLLMVEGLSAKPYSGKKGL